MIFNDPTPRKTHPLPPSLKKREGEGGVGLGVSVGVKKSLSVLGREKGEK